MLRNLLIALALAATALSGQASEGTVLITGANRGIGLALASEFSEAGYEVIGTARDPAAAKELRNSGARVERLSLQPASTDWPPISRAFPSISSSTTPASRGRIPGNWPPWTSMA